MNFIIWLLNYLILNIIYEIFFNIGLVEVESSIISKKNCDDIFLATIMCFHHKNMPPHHKKKLTCIHNQVEDPLEIHIMEDFLEEDYLIETHLEDYHLIHLLDFMDG